MTIQTYWNSVLLHVTTCYVRCVKCHRMWTLLTNIDEYQSISAPTVFPHHQKHHKHMPCFVNIQRGIFCSCEKNRVIYSITMQRKCTVSAQGDFDEGEIQITLHSWAIASASSVYLMERWRYWWIVSAIPGRVVGEGIRKWAQMVDMYLG